MNDTDQPNPKTRTSARQSAAQLRNHEMRFLKALRLLIEAGKARTTDDLIRYAEQDGQDGAVSFLRQLATERLPVDLAYDALSVNLRIVAHKRNSDALQECLNRRVGLVMPLPPHVIASFVSLMKPVILQPDHSHLPPSAERPELRLVQGSHAVRTALKDLNAIVLEAFQAGNQWLVDSEIAGIIEARLREPDLYLILHNRPHQNPGDVPQDFRGHTAHVI